MQQPRSGRFPENGIATLLEVNRLFNLAESTSQDLHFGELLDLVGLENVADLRLGYGSHQGAEILRDEIARACGVPPDQIIATHGTALALYLLAVELCRPGDEVVLFTPCFPPSRNALLGSDVHVREIPLAFETGYRVDVSQLTNCLTENTRMVSLATPQNPSGVTTSREQLDEILAMMKQIAPHAYLFIDETYIDATYGEAPVPQSFAGYHPRILTGGSLSKAYGAPGLRVGWITTQDADLRARLIVAKMNIVISGSPLSEVLGALLLANRNSVLGPRRKLLGKALGLVREWHRHEAHRLGFLQPDGGALCCMKLCEGVFDAAAVERFWNVLPSLDLQLAAGSWFGESDRVFRLGFGYLPLDMLPAALGNLSKAMDISTRGPY